MGHRLAPGLDLPAPRLDSSRAPPPVHGLGCSRSKVARRLACGPWVAPRVGRPRVQAQAARLQGPWGHAHSPLALEVNPHQERSPQGWVPRLERRGQGDPLVVLVGLPVGRRPLVGRRGWGRPQEDRQEDHQEDRQEDRQEDLQVDRQEDLQVDRQEDRRADRQVDRQGGHQVGRPLQ